MLLGYIAITLVVAAGVGAVVSSVPAIMTALTGLGAGYLAWLGICVLRDPPVPTQDDEVARPSVGWFVQGFGISGLNPKALLLYLALLPQFISSAAAWPLWLQMVVLGLVQIVNCGIVYTAVGVGSKIVLAARPGAARVVGCVSGVIMIGLALVLVVELVRK
jgi:threonine/homoserine/homoserine lactone efflux protein